MQHDEWNEKAQEIAGGIINPDSVMRYTSKQDAGEWIANLAREAYLRGRNEADIAAERREGGRVMSAKFEKQTYGAVVATILETDNSIVEVQERNDGFYGLIVHRRREDRDQWDDLTAYLKPEHFDALGSVARRMRGEQERCKGPYTPSEADTAAERRGIERAAKVASEVRNSQPFHDDHSSEFIDGWKAGEHDTAEIIANSIRALAQPAGASDKEG
jgi:hypothetical protein